MMIFANPIRWLPLTGLVLFAGAVSEASAQVIRPVTGALANNVFTPHYNAYAYTNASLYNPNAYQNTGANAYAAGPYLGYGDPYGGYLQGAASVINSQGNFMISQQQALLTQQSVKQAKVDTRRKVFDQWLYERANTPTLEDNREKDQREQLRRSLNDPPLNEIWSAKALNDVFDHLMKLQAQNLHGPEVPLDADTLRQINVTTGKDSSNVGLLKGGGRLDWPVALQVLPPEKETQGLRAQIETLLDQTLKQTTSGRPDAATLITMNRAVDKLGDYLRLQVHDLGVSQYMEGKRYLAHLSDSLKLLEHPDARNYLTGKYSARGRTVEELVRNMTNEGMRFAPAVAGEEAAYTALYRLMVAYDLGASHQLAANPK